MFGLQIHDAAFVADVLFSHILLNFVMCVYWAAVWNVFDRTMYPDNLLISYVISLGVGCGALIFLFIAETRLVGITKHVCRRNAFLGLVFEDCIKLIASLVTVFIWRGGWGLMKDYVLTDDAWDAWLCHIIGIGGLMVLQCGSTLSGLSVAVDGELGEGRDISFSVDYFSHLWRLYHSCDQQSLSVQVRTAVDSDWF